MNDLYNQANYVLSSKVIAIMVIIFSILSLIFFVLKPIPFLPTDMFWIGLFLGFFSLTLHEFGHLIAMRNYGLEVDEVGFILYFGLPMMYVDTTKALLLPSQKRILVFLSGPIINLFLFGIGYIFFTSIANPVFLLLMKINLFMFAYSMVPFVESDAKNIYMEVFDIISLKSRKSKAVFIYRLLKIPATFLVIIYSITFWVGVMVR